MSASPAIAPSPPARAPRPSSVGVLISHGLEEARSVIEERFLAAGEVLGFAVTGVGELIAALDQIAGALDPATVEASRSELQTAAESLLGLRVRLGARREHARGLVSIVEGLCLGVEDMRRELAYLRVFALNIKVTAAGVASAGEDFNLFAQEISDRIAAGSDELEAFAADLGGLHEQLAATLAEGHALVGGCERLVPAVPQSLERCAGEIATHQAKVGAVAAEVATLARGLQGKVGAALAAMQVGDSTRQRIEHVQRGLALLEAPQFAPQRQAATPVVRRLMAAQLAAAAEDFNRDACQLHGSLAGIAADATDLLRLRELALGRTVAGEAFLDRMLAQLGEALQLVDRIETSDEDAVRTAHAAVTAVEALTRRVSALQAIKTDVQQMALNTTLKCARMGDPGKPLSVIAIELRSHAGLLEASARRALETLENLAGQAAELVAESGKGAGGEALRIATARLRDADAAVGADLSAIADQGRAVVDSLNAAASRLDFKGEIGAVLDASTAALETAPGLADEADPDLLAEILQTIARSYTMAQERRVHAAMAADLPQAASAAAPAPQPSAELDEILF